MSEVEPTTEPSPLLDPLVIVEGEALQGLSPQELENLRLGVEQLVRWHVGRAGVNATVAERVLSSTSDWKTNPASKLRRCMDLIDEERGDKSQTVVATEMETSQSAVSELLKCIGVPRVSTLMRLAQTVGPRVEMYLVPSESDGPSPMPRDFDGRLLLAGGGLRLMTQERWQALHTILGALGIHVEVQPE